jgi:hypothetical protein
MHTLVTDTLVQQNQANTAEHAPDPSNISEPSASGGKASEVGFRSWICVDASADKTLLSTCKACREQKRYGADYNAAAHLRRCHFRQSDLLHQTPSMDVLKTHWIKQVHDPGPDSGIGSQPILDGSLRLFGLSNGPWSSCNPRTQAPSPTSSAPFTKPKALLGTMLLVPLPMSLTPSTESKAVPNTIPLVPLPMPSTTSTEP